MTRTTKYFGFGRTRKIIVAFVTLLAAVMLIVPITGINAYAEDACEKDIDSILLSYAEEFKQMNFEPGTKVVFIQAAPDIDTTNINRIHNDENLIPVNPTKIVHQQYFYNPNNSNYLGLDFEVMYGDGRAIYIDIIDGTCVGIHSDNSDFYLPSGGCTCVFSSDQSSVFVAFKCDHYKNNKLVPNDGRTISVVFEAGGGDVYGDIYA